MCRESDSPTLQGSCPAAFRFDVKLLVQGASKTRGLPWPIEDKAVLQNFLMSVPCDEVSQVRDCRILGSNSLVSKNGLMRKAADYL